MSKLKMWFRNYRFLVALTAFLVACALVLACLSHNPGSDWQETARALCSNLAAESLGAITSVVVIGWFLKRHEEQAMRIPRGLILDRVYALGTETVREPISAIPGNGQDEAAVNGLAFAELLEMAANRNLCMAIRQLPYVFSPRRPIEYSETVSRINEVASGLVLKWTHLFDLFGRQLTSDELASVIRVLNCLESVTCECHSSEWLMELQPLSDDQGRIIDSLLVLDQEVLRLLKRISESDK